MNQDEIRKNCPDGYSVNEGSAVDIIGFTKLARIFENHAEPEAIDLPDGLQSKPDVPWLGHCPPPAPEEWGRVLYYKLS